MPIPIPDKKAGSFALPALKIQVVFKFTFTPSSGLLEASGSSNCAWLEQAAAILRQLSDPEPASAGCGLNVLHYNNACKKVC